jgi:hypothetical protein
MSKERPWYAPVPKALVAAVSSIAKKINAKKSRRMAHGTKFKKKTD